jgi:hypothetical protein
MRILIVSTPKSGNTWLKCLLSKSYDLAWLRPTDTPAEVDVDSFVDWTEGGGFPDGTIFHRHYEYDPRLAAAAKSLPAYLVTIVRDPYDVFVSAYFNVQKQGSEGLSPKRAKKARQHPTFGKAIDDPRVIDYLTKGFRSSLMRGLRWVQSGQSIVTRYEALIADPLRELRRLTEQIEPVADERLKTAIDQCAPDRMRAMSASMASTIRTATVGDWRNHLGPEHLAIMRDRNADLVTALGYEVR